MSKFRKIRVLHVITRLLKWGGADKNTYDSIQALDPKRYSVDLVVGREAHLELLQAYDHGQVIQISSLVRDPNPILDIAALIQLFRLIARGGYDIVHTHTGKAGVLGRLAARLAKTPTIVHTLHGTMTSPNPILRVFYRQLDKWLSSFTDHFVSVGEDLMRRHLGYQIGDRSKYHVIHSGMDLDAFHAAAAMPHEKVKKKRVELGIREDAFVIGKVAALESRKGHKYTLQAAKKLILCFDKLQFVIVGEGELEHALRQWVCRHGLEDQIIFAGYRDDIAEVMAMFDIFLLTSLWEGLPQVLVQAAAVGKPIVSFAVEGAREVVVDGVNGYVVPIGDVETLTDRLDQLIHDPDKACSMGLAGRDVVGDQWSTKIMKEKTRAFYETVIHDGKG